MLGSQSWKIQELMQVISKIVKVDSYEYYVKHLQILNVIVPFKEGLTQKEIEVLAAFMCQDKSLIEEDMFNGVVRKKVMDKLNLKPGGLGNHLKAMIEKEVLIKNEITKKITVRPFLIAENNHQGYRLKFVKEWSIF